MSKNTHPPTPPQVPISFKDLGLLGLEDLVQLARWSALARHRAELERYHANRVQITDDAGVDKKKRIGRPRAMSDEDIRTSQGWALKLWPDHKHKRGAQKHVVELIRNRWEEHGIKRYYSTIVRHVMKPLGF
jgi:hypothetical protein